MNIEEILFEGKNLLKNNNIEDANMQVKQLLMYILKADSTYLIINNLKEVDKSQEEKIMNELNNLANGVPLQYITHHQEFMGLNLYVDKNVLIPQPDTETLVEEILNKYKNAKNLNILDICTGSGAIAVSLSKYMDKSNKITAVDISEEAIDIARKNAKLNNVNNIEFIKSNMFENVNEKYDIIVSNPPYIETETIKTLSKQVQNEPHIALDGGRDGLDFYRIIVEQSSNYLNDKGSLYLEIGYNQKDEIYKLFLQSKKYSQPECKKDMNGNDRVIKVSLL